MSDEIKNRTVYMLCRTGETGDDGIDIYIGSTSRPLKERLWEHQKKARKFKMLGYSVSNKLFTRMFDVGVRNWRIIPLLTFACDQKTIFEFEKQWIDLIGADLNIRPPITDRKKYNAGYYLENKKAIQQRHAGYREANKQNIREQQAGYREFNVQNKIHHCDVCNKSFGYRKDLDRHYKTLAHSYAYMDSVD